jgi:chemotaxis protein histidine kinase CheA
MGKYLKAAFVQPWNLVIFLGATALGIVSGSPEMVLPIVAVGELGYLGWTAANVNFRRQIDAEKNKTEERRENYAAQRALVRVAQSLPRESVERFYRLRDRCLELRKLAIELQNPGTQAEDLPFEEFQSENLDRLLWLHLRLLYSDHALERFMRSTNEAEIQRDIADLEQRIAQTAGETTPQKQKIRDVLVDNLATCKERIANLERARQNHELVKLEIERLEDKINSLVELAINRNEPEFISREVGQVAASVKETEQTISELAIASDLNAPEEPPELLRAGSLDRM